MGLNDEIKALKDRINDLSNSQETGRLKGQIKFFTWCAWGCVGIGALFLVYGGYEYFANCEFTINELGDYWGGSVGSFWALAGLFFIYVAFLGQKEQLIMQQLELKYSQLELLYTRKELRGQKTQMKQQNLTLSQQRFENTFFQLLNLYQNVVNNMDLQYSKDSKYDKTTGKDVFRVLYSRFVLIVLEEDEIPPKKVDVEIDYAIKSYLKVYRKYQSDLGHYFRTLYNIIKFTHENLEKAEEKKKYIRFVRALLSNDELVLLLYNGLSHLGKEKFKPLIVEYNLLDNLSDDYLFDPSHKLFYLKESD